VETVRPEADTKPHWHYMPKRGAVVRIEHDGPGYRLVFTDGTPTYVGLFNNSTAAYEWAKSKNLRPEKYDPNRAVAAPPVAPTLDTDPDGQLNLRN
jgi:hypothetical protein